jgi:hypothetical protein
VSSFDHTYPLTDLREAVQLDRLYVPRVVRGEQVR